MEDQTTWLIRADIRPAPRLRRHAQLDEYGRARCHQGRRLRVLAPEEVPLYEPCRSCLRQLEMARPSQGRRSVPRRSPDRHESQADRDYKRGALQRIARLLSAEVAACPDELAVFRAALERMRNPIIRGLAQDERGAQ